jgi:hypothetical protein
MAIAGATGISHMTALVVPSLLPDLYDEANILNRLDSLTLLDEEAVEGEACHHLRGTLNGTMEFWFNSRTFLVRRWVNKTVIDAEEQNRLLKDAMRLIPKDMQQVVGSMMKLNVPVLNPVIDCTYESVSKDCPIDLEIFSRESGT